MTAFQFVMSFLASIAFGIWQWSPAAGLFMYWFIAAVAWKEKS